MEYQNRHGETTEKSPETTPTSSFPANVMHKVKNNLVFRSKWAELNGAMGDLGTYIPIVLALTLAKDLNLGTTLIFTGVYNIVTGAIYGVPMPVQPMKSIAAVAISDASFGIPEVMAAGICTAGILLLLGVTGLMQLVYKLIPLSVVRGIQLAQGLSFAMTAVKYIRKVQNFSNSKSGGERHWLGLDGLVLALFCACFIIIVNGAGDESEEREINVDLGNEERVRKRRRLRKIIDSLPSALIIFLLGVVLAIIRGPKVVKGGLAGQYKFGGRSGGCVALLGAAKLVLGLVLGSSIVKVLDQFPVGMLGVLLLFAGIELAMCSRDMNSKEESFVMLVSTAVSLVGSSAALGFVCGIVAHLLLRVRKLGKDQSCSSMV
ncbi:hypothetical protein F0562_012430 [Nyssa sinensis]|uniref:SLC26A/SulP transporter domain-containing protein n=1 Tax=Nyssa sinensis TaxID=561372 RepID=A0A5J4ZXI5_9ASTE|nr:hypothetical protein F0562_012430 [Nyssa sinensis]